MKVVRSVAKMQELSRQTRSAGLTVGFVPTMGYLHDGHISLIRRARESANVVVVSIFVNPIQFNSAEDFSNYPRDEKTDQALLEEEGVDILFLPDAADVYPPGAATRVAVSGLTEGLCGAFRPGHFDGVATVVAALLNMVLPDVAVFGRKDFQQLQVVRRMVRDLHFGVTIVEGQTSRERDGLARSSRNARLNGAERAVAGAIYAALSAAAAAYARGQRSASALERIARERLEQTAEFRIEYLEIIDPDSIRAVDDTDDRSVMAIAAWLGPVRLIDNVILAEAAPALSEGTPTTDKDVATNDPINSGV